MTNKRAALYVRVSTDHQSVENQIRDLRHVAERRGWEMVETYSDAGISGSKGRNQRPGLDALLSTPIAASSISCCAGPSTGWAAR
jgi:DNA invertase Pin-like site-specific DNA recombinase